MSSILRIRFPKDFEERYRNYVAAVKSVSPEPIKPAEEPRAEASQDESEDTKKKPRTEVGKDGLGYLIFHDQRIPVGDASSGKFRLAEVLCLNFGVAKTIVVTFDAAKVKRNETDNNLESLYRGNILKLRLLEGQAREINRAITDYVARKKLKDFRFRMALKVDNKTNPHSVWLVERVVRRG